MVGGALNRINGVKDPNKLGSQHRMNKTGSVVEYQPTPIHILKAKSAAAGCEYDPVSNFSASSKRVTLPSCTKRSHSSDAVIPAKRPKVVVDNDEVEAKFSDSDDERTVVQNSTSGSVREAGSSVSVKAGVGSSLQSLSTNQPVSKVPKCTDNSPSKILKTSRPVSTTATKLPVAQSQPKDSSGCLSSSESQANVTVSSAHLVAVLNKDNSLGKCHSSSSKAVAAGAEKMRTNHSSSSGSSSKGHHKSTDQKNSDSGKISNTKHPHNMANSHHTSQPSDVTGRKEIKKDCHKHDGSSTHAKSNHLDSSEHSCSVTARDREVHCSDKHRKCTHDRSEQAEKAVAVSSSHGERQTEKLPLETSVHKPKSKPNSDDSSVDKHISSHGHRAKEHKTSHHKDCEHEQTASVTKAVTVPISHRDRQTEKSPLETSAHKSKSKANSGDSSVSKHTSLHGHRNKEYKTSRHKDCEDEKTTNVTNKHHSHLEGVRSHTESNRSKTASASSSKESRSSSHRHKSASVTDRQQTQLVAGSHAESCHSKTPTSIDSTVTDMKHVNAVRNIALFGEDSDTESDLRRLSSASAQVPVKRRELLHSRSPVSLSTSQSSDEVVLLPTGDLSDVSDNDDTFEQCQRLYNEFARQQQSKPATCTSSSIQSVSCFIITDNLLNLESFHAIYYHPDAAGGNIYIVILLSFCLLALLVKKLMNFLQTFWETYSPWMCFVHVFSHACYR